jgi:toxin secretion/phage lysis holin
MKYFNLGLLGFIGSAVINFFGGWSTDLATLVIFMAIDFITGLIVAGVFKKSKKTENGALESYIGFKGLAKKVMILLFVLIGHRLDLLLGSDYVRTALIIGFVVNETISITENAGLMGIPIPKPIKDAIDILRGENNDKRH